MIQKRLVIIDDQPEIRDFVAKVARMSGYDAQCAASFGQFEAIFQSWKPSLIVLDLHMPDIDGIELLRYLAVHRCQVPIVVISGVDPKIIESARLLGISYGLNIAAVLQKPLRIKELQEILASQGVTDDMIDEAGIRTAIEQRQFRLVFQPKVALAATAVGAGHWRTVGFEALLRWHHPQLGILAPAKFLPLAETLPLMEDLTMLVMAEAVGQLVRWRQERLETNVAFNISGTNLGSSRFLECLIATCRDIGAPPEALIIELTETAAMTDPIRAMDIMTRLRLKGFRLSIDDFGTGYSSLVQLQRLPFSELKIDRALVADCAVSRQSRVIVKSAIDLAQTLGLVACAEGIETAAVLDVIRQLGCDFAQGYHIARPMEAEQASAWLRLECSPQGNSTDRSNDSYSCG